MFYPVRCANVEAGVHVAGAARERQTYLSVDCSLMRLLAACRCDCVVNTKEEKR